MTGKVNVGKNKWSITNDRHQAITTAQVSKHRTKELTCHVRDTGNNLWLVPGNSYEISPYILPALTEQLLLLPLIEIKPFT